DALVTGEAIQNVDDFEALGSLRIVHSREVHQVVEIGFEFQEFEDGNGGGRFRYQEVLSEIGGEFGDLVAEAVFQLFREIAVPGCDRHRGGRFGWRMPSGGSGWRFRGCWRFRRRWFFFGRLGWF